MIALFSLSLSLSHIFSIVDINRQLFLFAKIRVSQRAPRANEPISSLENIFSPREWSSRDSLSSSHALCPFLFLGNFPPSPDESIRHERSKGDQDDSDGSILSIFARNYACWAHRGLAARCKRVRSKWP